MGISEDDFNAKLALCANTTERTALITETLSGKYKDAAEIFETTNKAVMDARDAQQKLMDAEAEAGEEVQRLKNALSKDFSFAAQGAARTTAWLVGQMADLAEESATAKGKYLDFVNTAEAKINSGNVEEVASGLREIQEETKRLEEQGIWKTISELGLFGMVGYVSQLSDLFDIGAEKVNEFNETGEITSDVAGEMAEAIDTVTASASGFNIQLEGTGLTAEEASSRLQTYTDAALDMFSKISTESELSYADAVANLEANTKATEDFANNMAAIAGSLPAELADMFAAGGPSMYAGVVQMLADANSGADEGLTQLNAAWEEGGKTAVDAFVKSLGAVPADTENPATIVAAQMEQDTSMEIAAEGVVSRTYTSFAASVESAGFDSAGRTAMQKFIDGMEAKRSDVLAKAQSIANDAKNKINSALSGIGSGSGRYSAGGLDYVPYNNYPAMLHAGEAVLTAQEAKDWRSGRGAGGAGITINQYITAVPQTPAELAAATEAYFEQARWAI